MKTQHTAVIGAQRGDEGKGKIVDRLAAEHEVVVRFAGGPNAGHTVVVGKEKFPLHLIPSGVLHQDMICLIGDGVVVDLKILLRELEALDKRVKRRAKILIGSRAQLIMPWHVVRDGIGGKSIGTTKKGIGPTYADATARMGIRVVELQSKARLGKEVQKRIDYNREMIQLANKLHEVKYEEMEEKVIEEALDANKVRDEYWEAWQGLKKHGVEMVDGSQLLWEAEQEGKRILFEGAQGTLLDITQGHYPYVTSSHPTTGGLYHGSGFRPRELTVIGVMKAYMTQVGEGPFPTMLTDKVGKHMQDKGHEFGTTTGRPRSCGWLDLVVADLAVRVNGIDRLVVTKLDILTGLKELKVAMAYKQGKNVYTNYPADTQLLEEVRPQYVELEGFSEDIQKARSYADLPKAAQKYVELIEEKLGVPVAMIGVGPERDELLRK